MVELNDDSPDDRLATLNGLERKISELSTAIDRQVLIFEKHDDPNHPVVVAAERRIGALHEQRGRLEAEVKQLASQSAPHPAFDLGAVLSTLPDLRPALATYSDEELAELFDVFDLEARYNHHENTLRLTVTVFPELAAALERERPAEAGRRNPFIAGAGFEPATSGL